MEQPQGDGMELTRAENYLSRGKGQRYRRKMFSRGGRRNKSSTSISDGDTPPRRWGFNLPQSSVSTSVPDIIMISKDNIDSDSTHALTPTDIDTDSGDSGHSSDSVYGSSCANSISCESDQTESCETSLNVSDIIELIVTPITPSTPPSVTEDPPKTATETANDNERLQLTESIGTKTEKKAEKDIPQSSFNRFRLMYLIVHTAIMLADGLQGTHLYVLYEGYGYSVASLYSLGFISGALTSPFIGPVVDRIGRKNSAMLYCVLEIIINLMEQYPLFIGLIASRVIGGITTNLLFSVFESWLVTEHRQRGFQEDKLEVILRDSTIVSNSAAIVSGYIAHSLASALGPVGPFEGAVTCTWIALLLVGVLWTENYGSNSTEVTSFRSHMVGAFNTIVGDTKISRIGLIQGLTEGTLQTFVFLWSPALRSFCLSAPQSALGLDEFGEPAYGLIFGGFMACGVIGGVIEPFVRRIAAPIKLLIKADCEKSNNSGIEVSIVCALCYLLSAVLLLTPCLLNKESPYAFSVSLAAFLCYEILVGVYMPCEGMIRSIFMPNESICSLMTMLRVIVNVAVALGVISTNYISFTSAFGTLSIMMVVAACLQISIIPTKGLSRAIHR